jgi:type I restriction enzyme, S subunit
MIWEFAKLCEVAQIVTGGTPLKSCEEYYGGDIPWVRPPELGSSIPVTETEIKLTCEGAKKLRMIPKDSVMVCCIGSVGKLGIAGTELATNQQINSLIFGAKILPKFGYYHCIHQAEYFKNSAPNAVVPIINKTNFGNYLIPVPPLAEQHRIVEILDQADTLRQQRRQADALSQRILPALFHQMFGDERWPSKPLEKVLVSIQGGWSPVCDNRPAEKGEWGVLKLGAATYCDYRPTESKALMSDCEPRKELEVKTGDLLFTRKNTRELVGATAYVFDTPSQLMIPDLIFRLIPDLSEVHPIFLWQALIQPNTRTGIRSLASGAAASMVNISRSKLLPFELPIPPLSLQNKFAEAAKAIRQNLVSRSSSATTLETLFQTLLHRTFDGSLTAQWREGHSQEILQEMQSRKP